MKKLLYSIICLAVLISCERENDAVDEHKGQISFSFAQKSLNGGRSAEIIKPAAIYVSIEDSKGNIVYDNKKLVLLEFGESYVTENLSFAVGAYNITKFIVVNASDKGIYACPVEGSQMAAKVIDPLPIAFSISENKITSVVPEVVPISADDVPEKFGYTSFGFEIVDGLEVVKTLVSVKIWVGEILYENVDANIVVNAYDQMNILKWTKTFPYTGPTDTLSIKNGFYSYELSLSKGQVTSTYKLSGAYLFESRVGGKSVTFNLGGTVPAKKISAVIEYFQNTNEGGMQPSWKRTYDYDAQGKLAKMNFHNYSKETNEFYLDRYYTFSYENNKVSKIEWFLAGGAEPYGENIYAYNANGNVSRINENYKATGNINSQVDFTYDYPNSIIKAAYTFSNGGSFDYEVWYNSKNIVADKTTKWGELCNDGVYTYDKNINPFKHLGYVDFLLDNFSINNRLTENINYKACSFPSLVLESVQYQYDADGYPTSAIRNYKSNPYKAQVKYFYQ